MNAPPTKSNIPESSAIAAYLPGAYFYDSLAISVEDPSLSALGYFLVALSATPSWVNRLMSIRNNVVSALGLKNLGTLSQLDQAKPASAYKPGDRVVVFTLIANSTDEVLLGDQDKHLDAVLSVHKETEAKSGQVRVTVTTVVHVHNWFGRFYMIPVTPMHRIIGSTVLKALGRRVNAV